MPVADNPQHIFEPTPLQCGQAVLSMLSGESVEEINENSDLDLEYEQIKHGKKVTEILCQRCGYAKMKGYRG